jgi:hypothetical protein
VVDEAEVAVLRNPVAVAVERHVVLRRHERSAGVEHALQHGEVLAIALRQHVDHRRGDRRETDGVLEPEPGLGSRTRRGAVAHGVRRGGGSDGGGSYIVFYVS